MKTTGLLALALFLVQPSFSQDARQNMQSQAGSRPLGFLEELSEDDLTLTITGVSATLLVRTNLNRERFEQYLSEVGPDYEIVVFSGGSVRRILKACSEVDFTRMSGKNNLDLRVRLLFASSDGRVQRVLYATSFGQIWVDGVELEPVGHDNWLKQAWAILDDEMFP